MLKRSVMFVLVFAAVGSARGAPPRSVEPLRKVVVMALAKDPRVVRDIEVELRALLAGRKVESASYSSLFPPDTVVSPAKIRSLLKAQGYDSVLILRSRRNIRWSVSESSGTLDEFLKVHPSASGREAEFVIIEPQTMTVSPETPLGTPGSQPIPGSSPKSGYQVLKLGMIVFDVSTGNPRWQDTLPVKIPYNLPTHRVEKQIAQRCFEALSRAGLVAPH